MYTVCPNPMGVPGHTLLRVSKLTVSWTKTANGAATARAGCRVRCNLQARVCQWTRAFGAPGGRTRNENGKRHAWIERSALRRPTGCATRPLRVPKFWTSCWMLDVPLTNCCGALPHSPTQRRHRVNKRSSMAPVLDARGVDRRVVGVRAGVHWALSLIHI